MGASQEDYASNIWRIRRKRLERAKGIEPSYAAWEAAVLPLNYARGTVPASVSMISENRYPLCGNAALKVGIMLP
jgi:hypothetical protein